MRTLFAIAFLLIATLPASAANFPYIRLNGKTNVVSDNGTNLTYNGSAIGGGGANWTADGTTNSTLSGIASMGRASIGPNNDSVRGIVIDSSANTTLANIPNALAFVDTNFFGKTTGLFLGTNTPAFFLAGYGNGGGGLLIQVESTNTISLGNNATMTFTGISLSPGPEIQPGQNDAIFAFHGQNEPNDSMATNMVVFVVDNDFAYSFGSGISIFSVANRTDDYNKGWGAVGVNVPGGAPESTFQVNGYETNRVVAMFRGTTNQSSNIFEAQDVSSNIVASVSAAGAIAAGSTNAWKLGAVKTCSGITMIVTNYIEVVINGVTNAIPLGTVTP